ncbi:MAG: uracil-DNA glycosylase family protein [Paludibacteraceae bacterium]|nr:uracil-DNA glycosylase family protein [Paludibacteraceae bacterium]
MMQSDTFLNTENINRSNQDVEYHPLLPFLPEGTKVLFLGSFPPQRKRWSMDFFYPNFINDHWRIMGLIFFGDKNHFVDVEAKCFKLDLIVDFAREKGIGYYDTSEAVKRLKDNASDKFLEVVEYTDINAMLEKIPECRVVVTTGEKATENIVEQMSLSEMPTVGNYIQLKDNIILYRLPSSSRAYPLSLDKKTEAYRKMFETVKI